MTQIHPVALAHERGRWMRADAYRFIRPDWRRFVAPGSELEALYESFERKYRPDQPRVPAGAREGGQWTADGGGTTTLSAQRRRGGGGGPGGGLEPTPAQAARLTVAEAQAQAAIARVRQYDQNWQPTPSLYETVEGQIAARQADTREAEARLAELAGVGVGPGPFAVESIAAGPSITAADRIELNRIFSEYGCHTCGTFEAGTKSGNPIADHQPPTALRALGSSARLYPQCIACSVRQGGYVRSLSGR